MMKFKGCKLKKKKRYYELKNKKMLGCQVPLLKKAVFKKYQKKSWSHRMHHIFDRKTKIL